MTFAVISPDLQSGEQESVCRFELTDFIVICLVYDGHSRNFLASDYDPIWLEEIKHVWYFQLILEHILFSFVTHLLTTRDTLLSEFVVIGTILNSGSVWSSVV